MVRRRRSDGPRVACWIAENCSSWPEDFEGRPHLGPPVVGEVLRKSGQTRIAPRPDGFRTGHWDECPKRAEASTFFKDLAGCCCSTSSRSPCFWCWGQVSSSSGAIPVKIGNRQAFASG